VTKEQPFTLQPVSKLTPGENGLLPPLSDDEYAALKADVETNGVLVPISIDEDDVVIDGHHRLKVCQELDIETVPTRVHSMLDPAPRRDLALALNLNRRNLSQKQKREVIAAVLRQDPELSSNSIAAAVGVSDKTVGSVRAELVERSEIPNAKKRTDSKGRKQPATKTKGTSGRRQASGSKSTAKPGRARTRAEATKAKPEEAQGNGLPFLADDADLRERVQEIANAENLTMNAWLERVVRDAVETAEANEQKEAA